jgi:hypothetical protein
MSRLFLLNVLLLAGIAMATLYLLELRDEAGRREEMVRESAPKLPAAKGTTAAPLPERTVAANYLDVAARLLFSKDRNPTVIIAPPPEKKQPEMPVAYGVLMVADPPIIMMSAKKGQAQKGYRMGEKIGDFKIVQFDSRTIVLDWDGEKITKKLADLADRDAQTAALLAGQNQQNVAAAPAAPAAGSTQVLSQPAAEAKQSGPGMDTGGGVRACAPGDTTPPGTVQDGYRKIVSESPFGKVCRWEQVK